MSERMHLHLQSNEVRQVLRSISRQNLGNGTGLIALSARWGESKLILFVSF
jgi:hypothetical protein